MNPWVLVGALVVFGIAAGDDMRLRVKIEAMEAAAAKADAAAEKRVSDARDADSILRASLASQATALKQASQEQINAATVALSRVVSNPACVRTPAAVSFDGSLLPSPGTSTPRKP